MVRTTSDLRFLGQSDTDGWDQEINVKNTGIKGIETAKNSAIKEETLTLDSTEEITGYDQIAEIPFNQDPSIAAEAPLSNINLGDGNNELWVSSTIGENSLWIANSKAEDCEDTPTKDTKSILNLESVAVEDYNITGGTGQDEITLLSRVNPEFIESWEEEMNDLSLETKEINTQTVALRGSFLNTGAGSDRVLAKGDITGSNVNLGPGTDQIHVDGSIKGSLINLGDGNDIALLASPPELTSLLLGGAGLDALSFSGSTQSIRIDLHNQTVNYAKIDSFEAGTGGLGDDILIAGEDTVFLDGEQGNDTYILNSQRSETTTSTPLNLALSPSDILNKSDQLVRWDEPSDTYYKQEGVALGLNLDQTNTLPLGTELLPIGTLESLINFMGISDTSLSQISPWAMLEGGGNITGNSLIQWDSGSTNSYNLVAELASDPSQDFSSTASAV